MKKEDIEQYTASIKAHLLSDANWRDVMLTRDWANGNVPDDAGVYVFKMNNDLVYVGETGNLRKRMLDMLDSRNHVLRRTLGKLLFEGRTDFTPATTSAKFCDEIEKLLDDHIVSSMQVSWQVVPFGRKEIEESIFDEIDIEIRLNKRGKRGTNKKAAFTAK